MRETPLAVLSCLLALAGPLHALEREVVIRSDAGAPAGVCGLGATLNLPDQAVALVVFVHGSGAQNRDESIPGGPAPFRDIARALSARNVASLRFDKRSAVKACLPGITDPADRSRAHPDLLTEHFLKDVEAAYRFAAAQAGGIPVYVLAHSEGVNFVLELAARKRIAPAGLILLAGLGRYPIDATFLRQLRAALPKIDEALKDPRLDPETRRDLEKARARTAAWLSDGASFFQRIRSGEARKDDYYVGAYSGYWKDWIAMTDRAAETAAAAGKPSLLLQGGADANVTKDDFDALSAALKPAGGSAVYLDGLDHLFLKPGSGQVDGAVPEAIASWLGERLRPTAAPLGVVRQAEASALLRQLKALAAPASRGL